MRFAALFTSWVLVTNPSARFLRSNTFHICRAFDAIFIQILNFSSHACGGRILGRWA